MLNKDQSQHAGDGSIAIQANGNITIGITATEARNIAHDVSKNVFYELSGVARNVAEERVEEIINRIIEKLTSEFPHLLERAKDPDFQYSLFTAQKNFARTGDKNLKELLVDLLINYSQRPPRSLLQITLRESIETAEKLTEKQLAAISLIFSIRHIPSKTISTHFELGEYLDQFIKPFAEQLPRSEANYQHLIFARCGIPFVHEQLEDIFGGNNESLFSKGFDPNILPTEPPSMGYSDQFFMRCHNNESLIQARGLNRQDLDQTLREKNLSPGDHNKIYSLFCASKMQSVEIADKLTQIRPYMSEVLDAWNNSALGGFSLTSVGIALAHANIRHFHPEISDISDWIH